MPIGRYRVIAFGNSLGIGVSGSQYVTVNAVAKRNGDNAAYCIPNEMICAEIGHFLGLPIPPWGIVSGGASPGESWFATLDFNLTGNALPPVTPSECCSTLPDESTGLLVFDALVANSDRHTGNLSVDMLASPPHMNVFDHSHALFGYMPAQGVQRLTDLQDRLAMSGGSRTHGNRHCLIDALATDTHFGKWLDRVEALPDFLIDDVCDSAVGLGIDRTEAVAAKEFLKHRRNALRQIIENHRVEFRAIQQWSLF